jgi:SAM-dependent methyltransferase
MNTQLMSGDMLKIVCPRCHGTLQVGERSYGCAACGARFPVDSGMPDLIVGDRYDDDTPDCALCNEETTNRDTARRYWSPMLWRVFGRQQGVRILSLGCGVGADVDTLVTLGWDAYGADNGKRASHWRTRRTYPERLFLANGKSMPFPAESFDLIFCGCVFPHVGVIGTTFDTTPDFHEQRCDLVREIARVLKPGGSFIGCNPNRFFPLDIFHGHQAGKPVLRPTMPWHRLLLSKGDYARMFGLYGRFAARALPNANYWSFTNSRRTLKGRLLAAPVQGLFQIVSKIRVLRASPLNPWLVVQVTKAGQSRLEEAFPL